LQSAYCTKEKLERVADDISKEFKGTKRKIAEKANQININKALQKISELKAGLILIGQHILCKRSRN
jgi:C-terminal processing protease CtpA/Prc